jgi:hypothetical protein
MSKFMHVGFRWKFVKNLRTKIYPKRFWPKWSCVSFVKSIPDQDRKSLSQSDLRPVQLTRNLLSAVSKLGVNVVIAIFTNFLGKNNCFFS